MTRLTVELMANAYAQGYFPMADPDEGNQIYWYLPEVRTLLPLDGLHLSRSLRKTLRQERFEIRVGEDFEAIVRACADREETWLSDEIIDVFLELHSEGLALSVGAYREGKLAGGIYGMALGRAFFAESMFHNVTDASKVALVGLVQWLGANGFELLDVQFMTEHLRGLGAYEVDDDHYQKMLARALAPA